MFTSCMNRRTRRFYVEVGQWTARKCIKKHDARTELLICRDGCLSSLLYAFIRPFLSCFFFVFWNLIRKNSSLIPAGNSLIEMVKLLTVW